MRDRYLRPYVPFFLLVGEGAASKPDDWFEGPEHPALLFRPFTVGEVQGMGAGLDDAKAVESMTDVIGAALVGSRGDLSVALSVRRTDFATAHILKMSATERGALLREGLAAEEMAALAALIKRLSGVTGEEKNASKT